MRPAFASRWQGVGRAVHALLVLVLLAGCFATLRADMALPPKPTEYFIDDAHVVDAGTAAALNSQLQQFERDTSNQILVAIYPSLPPGAEIAQYATQSYNAWGVGQKGSSLGQKGGNNGAVLFVFINDHKMFIATGRGLEGALPDATCKNIIDGVIAPAFKRGDYAGGVRAGVNAMIAASKGEYVGTGQTDAEREQQDNSGGQGAPPGIVIVFIIVLILIFILSRRYGSSSPYIYTGGGFGGGGFGGGFGGGGGGFWRWRRFQRRGRQLRGRRRGRRLVG